MQIEVIMTLEDYIEIQRELVSRTGLCMYEAHAYEDLIQKVDIDMFQPRRLGMSDRYQGTIYSVIGPKELEGQILGKKPIDHLNADKNGFVSCNFGGENDDAIATTFYLASASEAAKLISRELKKILKIRATLGVKDHADSDSANIFKKYWTPAALKSGKNWKTWLGRGVNEHKNKLPGWVPAML